MKVLHLVIYEKLYPPKNGGMLRCWNLIQQLGKYAELDVVTLQNLIPEKSSAGGYPVSKKIHFLAPSMNDEKISAPFFKKLVSAIQFRFFYRTLSSVDANFLKIIPVLRSIKDNQYDVIIFEHLESLVVWKKMKQYFPRATFIFDAHNVDHILLSKKEPAERIAKIKKLEKSLFTMFDRIWACSNADATIFRDLNEDKIPVTVAPNGIDICRNPYQMPDLSKPGQLIFCGSLDYEPNVEGLTWFLKSVWPVILSNHHDFKLIVVGRGQPPAVLLGLLENNPSIELIGEVDDVIPYYRQAQVAIAPLLHGSGTRLKILEAMSLGIPVVTTRIGVEGLTATNGKELLIADDPQEFAKAIINLVKNKELFGSVSAAARQLVEETYDWEKIGGLVNSVIA